MYSSSRSSVASLTCGELAAQLVEGLLGALLQAADLRVAALAPGALELEQARLEIGIAERTPIASLEGRRRGAHSSTATVIRPGPWTPIVSDRSMSAVRDGPVTKVA